MNDLAKGYIELRKKFYRMCEAYPDCKECIVNRPGICSFGVLTEEEAEKVANWTAPVTTETPRDTPVLVRDYDNEAWREAYLCAKLQSGVIVFMKEDGGKYTMCKSDEANGVRRFNQCKLR